MKSEPVIPIRICHDKDVWAKPQYDFFIKFNVDERPDKQTIDACNVYNCAYVLL